MAGVRELETIGNFLTGSAPTLVIDLFFTFVFLAVMFYYARLLTCTSADPAAWPGKRRAPYRPSRQAV